MPLQSIDGRFVLWIKHSQKEHKKLYIYIYSNKQINKASGDALPSPGVNPLEGLPKCSCGKLGLERRSRLPTLERGRGSSWEPMD
jgi:hypothetical protein